MSKYERPGWHDLDAGQAVLDEQQRLLAEAMAAEDAGDLALRDECLQDVLALTRIERIVDTDATGESTPGPFK